MAYNRSLQRPGKAHRERPEKEWIVAVGGHEGLMEGETWVRVQEMLLRNGKKATAGRKAMRPCFRDFCTAAAARAGCGPRAPGGNGKMGQRCIHIYA